MTKLTTIKNRRDFLSAGTHGRKFVVGTFILLAHRRAEDHPEPAQHWRIGFTTTKKLGGAVVRNRIRRRLREAARQALPPLVRPGFDYVLIARSKALACDFSELTRDMAFAFSKIAAKNKPS